MRKRALIHPEKKSARKLNADGRELVKILVILVASIGGLCLLIGLYYWMKVSKIECQTQRGRCSVEMVAWLNGFNGYPVPWAVYKINQETRTQFEFVNNIHSQIVWPSTIVVKTELAAPALTVTSPALLSAGTYYTATFDGIMLEKTTEAVEPIVVLDNLGTPIGKKLDKENINAIQIAYHLSSLGYKFQAKIEKNSLNILTSNSPMPKSAWFNLDDKKSPAELVSQFQVIMRQNALAGLPITIDMRYDRPVIRTLVESVAGEATENQ